MDIYAEHILEHYKHPQHQGTLTAPDFSAEDSNPLCGDKIRFEMKLGADGKVTEVGFTNAGCAISTAAASMLTEEVIGKDPEELSQYSPERMLELMEIELTPARVKCALLAQAVMKKSILEKKYNL